MSTNAKRSEKALDTALDFLRNQTNRVAFHEYSQENYPAMIQYIKSCLGQDILDMVMSLRNEPNKPVPSLKQEELDRLGVMVSASASNYIIHVLAYLYFENLMQLEKIGFNREEAKLTGYDKANGTIACGGGCSTHTANHRISKKRTGPRKRKDAGPANDSP
jgi:hypothetical protein